jgi:hypothetical protein
MIQQEHVRHKRGWIPIAALLAACAWACMRAAPAGGAQESASQSKAVEPAADEILKAAGKYLGDAKSFTFTAEVWEDTVLAEGQKVKRQKFITAGVRRPDGLFAETHNSRIARGVWYDGKTFTLYNRQKNFYGTVDAPDTIDKTIQAIDEKFGISLPLSDFATSDLYGAVIKNVRRGMYLGRQTIAGVRCHHLAFVQEDIDWEMWVEDGGSPVIRKYLITFKQEDQAPQYEATLSDWNFDARLSDYAFTFRPPLGASRIDVRAAESREEPGEANVARDVQPAEKPQDKKD